MPPSQESILVDLTEGNISERLLLNLINKEINVDYFSEEVSSFEFKLARKAFQEISGIVISSTKDKIPASVLEKIMNDENFKKSLLCSLNDIDSSIDNLETENLGFADNCFRSSEPSLPAATYQERNILIRTIHNVNAKKYSLPIQNESKGIKKFIQDFYMIYSSLLTGSLFVSDEFSNEYHPMVQDYIINKFRSDGKEHKAQLLFSTHDIYLLDQKRFSKEQILLAVKDRNNLATSVEILSQYKNLSNNDYNWAHLYLEGRFGGIPEIYY